MLRALADDLLAIDNVELHILADARLAPFWPVGCQVHEVRDIEDELLLLSQLAADCDSTILIAPESDNHLLHRCRWIEKAGGRMQSPDSEYIALAADKSRLAEHLAAAGIPVPKSVTLSADDPPVDDVWYPVVLKPLDGAGSVDVRRVYDAAQLAALRTTRPVWRVERFRAGIPASVAVLCGSDHHVVLQPGRQLLSADESFTYHGGEWPLPPGYQERATQLAHRVVAAMPRTRGYIGIDLVLGGADDGRGDVVIEVNPRLTTSYCGLRQLAETNLAAVMLQVAEGTSATVSWREQAVLYRVDAAPSGTATCTG